MSCWVVPTLAAELWGVPLDHVLGQMRSGEIFSKVDCGFVVVDVAPGSAYIAPSAPGAVAALPPPPATFVPASIVLSAEEVAALQIESGAFVAGAEPSAAEIDALNDAPLVPIPASLSIKPCPSGRGAGALLAERVTQRSLSSSGRIQRRNRIARPEPLYPTADIDSETDEMGPDPNEGEVDNGKPLDWQAARTKAAAQRRRPPPLAAD